MQENANNIIRERERERERERDIEIIYIIKKLDKTL